MKILAHLKPDTRRWLRGYIDTLALEPHHLRLLVLAGEYWDRGEQARKVVDELGPTYEDRFGQPCKRPEVGIENDCRLGFARMLKAVPFDIEPPRPGPGRPPRSEGGY